MEAGGIFQEGVSIKDLDRAIKRFGFPVGPATLFDEVGVARVRIRSTPVRLTGRGGRVVNVPTTQVGIDVGNHIQPTLVKAFGDRLGGASTEMMEEMVQVPPTRPA